MSIIVILEHCVRLRVNFSVVMGLNLNHRRCLIHHLSPLMCTKTGDGLPLICADILKAE